MSDPVIAFLHTAGAHQATFNHLLKDHPVSVTHEVREDWLTTAQQDGLTDELIDDVSGLLREMEQEADVVVCSCSTLGPIVQSLNRPNVLRVDQPLMAAAAAIPGTTLLAMCLDSTVDASTVLLENAFTAVDREPDYEVVTCPDAWDYFLRGETDTFAREIASAIRTETDVIGNLGCIVLAQASMSTAADQLDSLGVPVLTSPPLVVQTALEIAGVDNNTAAEPSSEMG